MDALPLDPGSYAGTYKLIGGQLSLDFVNTVSWPGTPRAHDWLETVENVVAWTRATGLIGAAEGIKLVQSSGAGSVNQVLRLRDDLSAVLRPLAHGERIPAGAVDRLNDHLDQACARRRIHPTDHTWGWKEPETWQDVLAPVVWSAGHTLTEVDRTRLGYCPGCDWVFYDSTRNRSRRWCDMEDCGSRDKALRYYHRTRSRGDG